MNKRSVERYTKFTLGLHDPHVLKLNSISHKWNMSTSALIRLMIDRFPEAETLPEYWHPVKGKENG
jgi:hypothetical protein